ncbi:aminopeptidase [Candidatus Parcubacteria bacterium]|nr:aminopeptidase [Patescibacteria group bacterium]MBU4309127.1 aminopeptidase [Patescibacteria group bacterium]MBU4432186.1 aminopeptidase [Patescibacteria group bacterium]MBU4577488.1 aminopeptidase [Patescibacteria group bacterium]MCG2697176.1 aminopeptidase [Candidatus Parcubacteria bacterium]
MPKKDYKKIEKELTFAKRNCWDVWGEAEQKKALAFSEGYKDFLNKAKTEREAVSVGVEILKKKGFKSVGELKSLKAGDKFYSVNRGKGLIAGVIGKKLFDEGFRLVMSHIDSPRLDAKVMPLYEDEKLAFLKTHYYGGIKKYHWPTIQLSLHGFVVLKNGKQVSFVIGEDDNDPIFMITDLLPHLARRQMEKTLDKGIVAEELNILIGSIPVVDKDIKERVKLAILEHLNIKYGMIEEDFYSAEIEAVPSAKARDLGFDRSMVAAYGQDDRVCAYGSFDSLLTAKSVNQTQIIYWVDKEEVGSEGLTGAISNYFEVTISKLLGLVGKPKGFSEVHELFSRSMALSSDVTAGYDPDYKDVHDPLNAARLGFGVALERHTGHRGKSSTSEANAEYVQKIRTILNAAGVIWQSAGLGKVDEGGGGTIAMFMASRNLEIIDIGVPLFNMHAPMEIASKADIYSTYLAYKAFFEN